MGRRRRNKGKMEAMEGRKRVRKEARIQLEGRRKEGMK
jgi:hypothetical protein